MAVKAAPPDAVPAVRIDDGVGRGQQATLRPDTLVFQQAAGNGEGASVTFIALEHVPEFIRHLPSNGIGDKGEKTEAKPLSKYVGSHTGPILVRAPYKNAGQALRGARTVLKHCHEQRNTCHCIIAVAAAVFAKLHAKAAEAGEAPQFLSPSMQILRDQCEDLKIPKELRKKFLGGSSHADWVRRLIVLASRSNQPVLILGATGTGKEVVARQIHDLSDRASGAFLPVNCAGISKNLFESELFGHVKGAFTGAVRDKKGFWSVAHNGTLFLDEIGDLKRSHQVKILRALEDGRFTPVGDTREVSSNARIIAATNRDLSAMVEAGTFREDLYYRLHAFRLRTPSLAAHPEDVPEIALHLWGSLAGPRALPTSVLRILSSVTWPGNVRELRAFLNHLLLLSNNKPVTATLAQAVLEEYRGRSPGVGDW